MTDLLVDTSVAIPLLVSSHAAHAIVNTELAERSVALAGHALHETYAVLTRLPGDARVAPLDALRLLATLRVASRPRRERPHGTRRGVGRERDRRWRDLRRARSRSPRGRPNCRWPAGIGRARDTYRLLGVVVEMIVEITGRRRPGESRPQRGTVDRFHRPPGVAYRFRPSRRASVGR